MPSAEQTELWALVVEACVESVGFVMSGQFDLDCWVISEPYFIKWGDRYFHHVAATQKYIYDQAVRDLNTPHVPKVYNCFDHGVFMYLVMEYIQTSPPEDIVCLHQKTVDAINWLLHLPIPPGTGIGLLGGGYTRHLIFKDWSVPLLFSCNKALEIYLNEVKLCFLYFPADCLLLNLRLSAVFWVDTSGTHPD